MAISDPLGDLLARIRNGQRSRMATVLSPASRLRERVLDVLKREGYICDFSRKAEEGTFDALVIELKYREGEPVIRDIERVSTPGRRVYSKIRELPRVAGGLGISILSTPKGVMSDAEARAQNVGGEVLCNVF
ncbi:MAG: 30S ribosomal protein S8 [Alphaproteobacteria bacterium]|nr:30S ribosomal protein S8 [Alphaproteobacteria bacterium]